VGNVWEGQRAEDNVIQLKKNHSGAEKYLGLRNLKGKKGEYKKGGKEGLRGDRETAKDCWGRLKDQRHNINTGQIPTVNISCSGAGVV